MTATQIITAQQCAGEIVDAMLDVLDAHTLDGYAGSALSCDHEQADTLREAAVALAMGRVRGGSTAQRIAGDMAAAGLGKLDIGYIFDDRERSDVLGEAAMMLLKVAGQVEDPAGWVNCEVQHA